MRSELSLRRPASDREQLFAGGSAPAAGVGAPGGRDIETMSGAEILEEGKKINQTDIDLLKGSNALLETETLPVLLLFIRSLCVTLRVDCSRDP